MIIMIFRSSHQIILSGVQEEEFGGSVVGGCRSMNRYWSRPGKAGAVGTRWLFITLEEWPAMNGVIGIDVGVGHSSLRLVV